VKYLKGTMYGTTYLGGGAYDSGTFFSITPNGTETVLHSFCDGCYPSTRVIDVNGVLCGTTKQGGQGFGTVFTITRLARRRCCTRSTLAATELIRKRA